MQNSLGEECFHTFVTIGVSTTGNICLMYFESVHRVYVADILYLLGPGELVQVP